MNRSQYTRLQNRDSIAGSVEGSFNRTTAAASDSLPPPHSHAATKPRTLRKKVSRAFSSFTGRSPTSDKVKVRQASSESPDGGSMNPLSGHPATPLLSETRSCSTLVDDDHAAGPASTATQTRPMTDAQAYSPPDGSIASYYYNQIWRIDPVLVGYFVCL